MLSYIVSHEAWYHQAVTTGEKEIIVQQAHPEGGVYWEFTIAEVILDSAPVLKVRVFADAFRAFREMPEFFAALREDHRLVDVIDLLNGLGAVDITDRREGEPRMTANQRLEAIAKAASGQVHEWHGGVDDHPQDCTRPLCVAVVAYEAGRGPR